MKVVKLELVEHFYIARKLTVTFSVIVNTMNDSKVTFAQLAAGILTSYCARHDMWQIPMVTETPTPKIFMSKVQSPSFGTRIMAFRIDGIT